MAYNHNNRFLHIRYIIDTYLRLKERDKPDIRILRIEFPKYGIYISYRTWMKIKNMRQSDYNSSQPDLFNQPDA